MMFYLNSSCSCIPRWSKVHKMIMFSLGWPVFETIQGRKVQHQYKIFAWESVNHEFSSVPWPIGSSGAHDGWWSRQVPVLELYLLFKFAFTFTPVHYYFTFEKKVSFCKIWLWFDMFLQIFEYCKKRVLLNAIFFFFLFMDTSLKSLGSRINNWLLLLGSRKRKTELRSSQDALNHEVTSW